MEAEAERMRRILLGAQLLRLALPHLLGFAFFFLERFAYDVGLFAYERELFFETCVGFGADARDLGFQGSSGGLFGLPANFFGH
jgi:hypothetical protein